LEVNVKLTLNVTFREIGEGVSELMLEWEDVIPQPESLAGLLSIILSSRSEEHG
jgi:hypothetical protein